MNLFRSEEHVRNWPAFDPDSADGIMPLADYIEVFSAEDRKHKLDGNYVSYWQSRRVQLRLEILRKLGKTSPFWIPT